LNFKYPKHLEKYIVISAAIMVVFLEILNITSNSIIFGAILSVLALLMFFLIKLENKIDNLRTGSINHKLNQFYQNRHECPSLETLLSKAKKEIVIWGANLSYVTSNLTLLERKLDEKCEIKLLLMSLHDEDGKQNPLIGYVSEILKDTIDFEGRLKNSHKVLINFYESLKDKQKDRFEVKIYNNFPSA
jgi:hypothetical protein